MTATCIIPNCRKRAPASEPFCSDHRDSPADKLKDRAIVAAEYRLHCSPHEWTDDDSEAMARYILALHGPAISRMPVRYPTPQQPGGYIGDTWYADGGTVATHRWDGERWATLGETE